MNTVNKYRVDPTPGMPTKRKIAVVSPHAPGFQNHPDIVVSGWIMHDLDPEQADTIALYLNMAFNAGRDFARQR